MDEPYLKSFIEKLIDETITEFIPADEVAFIEILKSNLLNYSTLTSPTGVIDLSKYANDLIPKFQAIDGKFPQFFADEKYYRWFTNVEGVIKLVMLAIGESVSNNQRLMYENLIITLKEFAFINPTIGDTPPLQRMIKFLEDRKLQFSKKSNKA